MYKAHWCLILFRNITLTSVIHQIITSQEGHVDSESEILVKYHMTSFCSFWFEFPNCLLMFIFSFQCGLKAEAKYLHLSGRMLEMGKWHKWLTFISHPSLIPIPWHVFPFHYPQFKAGKITFSLFSSVMLCF